MCSYKFRKIHRKTRVPELSVPKACNFIKKETLTQVFFCEFCEISQNTFPTEHLWMTASETHLANHMTFLLISESE